MSDLPDLERLCILESFSLEDLEGDDLVAASALSVEAIVNIADRVVLRRLVFALESITD